MEVSTEQGKRFDAALREFKRVANDLEDAWYPAITVTGYPDYLPSFDEFTSDFSDVAREVPAEQRAVEALEDTEIPVELANTGGGIYAAEIPLGENPGAEIWNTGERLLVTEGADYSEHALATTYTLGYYSHLEDEGSCILVADDAELINFVRQMRNPDDRDGRIVRWATIKAAADTHEPRFRADVEAQHPLSGAFQKAVCDELNKRGVKASYEYPGFVSMHFASGATWDTGQHGWDYATATDEDGDLVTDFTPQVDLAEDASPAQIAEAWATAVNG